jgi:hypothetical protein
MADSWTYWQREAAGQSDRGVTTQRVLVLAVVGVLVALLWLPHLLGAETRSTGGAGSPHMDRPRCEQLRTMPPHGPTYWSLKPLCTSGHRSRTSGPAAQPAR